MKNELQSKFYNRFKFYKPAQNRQDFFFFGFECGDGWFKLLWKLSEDLQKAGFANTGHVLQVKEKLGGLRFYVDGANDEQWKIIEEAEQKSYGICECCGEPGKQYNMGWIYTVCEKCLETIKGKRV